MTGIALRRTVMVPKEMKKSKASDRLKEDPLGSFAENQNPRPEGLKMAYTGCCHQTVTDTGHQRRGSFVE